MINSTMGNGRSKTNHHEVQYSQLGVKGSTVTDFGNTNSDMDTALNKGQKLHQSMNYFSNDTFVMDWEPPHDCVNNSAGAELIFRRLVQLYPYRIIRNDDTPNEILAAIMREQDQLTPGGHQRHGGLTTNLVSADLRWYYETLTEAPPSPVYTVGGTRLNDTFGIDWEIAKSTECMSGTWLVEERLAMLYPDRCINDALAASIYRKIMEEQGLSSKPLSKYTKRYIRIADSMLTRLFRLDDE
jgi:phage terminase large subunit-like protein